MYGLGDDIHEYTEENEKLRRALKTVLDSLESDKPLTAVEQNLLAIIVRNALDEE